MEFIEKMKNCANILSQRGFSAVTPEEADWKSIDKNKMNQFKRAMSAKYFNEVAHKTTGAVLVVNETKMGIPNYIGANTFAEIAIAFFSGKKIYLLNDFYPPYLDELAAWGAMPLLGKIENLFEMES
ncbi:hypothetical protein [Enterococcus timonensis]|uniref:hypothetical protein n=1 Tax=Enterococcus timonensis TaxID=1852364 RepID=UPI00131A1AB2|nr:hypothetical protein [Enterococcus timonensis]